MCNIRYLWFDNCCERYFCDTNSGIQNGLIFLLILATNGVLYQSCLPNTTLIIDFHIDTLRTFNGQPFLLSSVPFTTGHVVRASENEASNVENNDGNSTCTRLFTAQ